MYGSLLEIFSREQGIKVGARKFYSCEGRGGRRRPRVTRFLGACLSINLSTISPPSAIVRPMYTNTSVAQVAVDGFFFLAFFFTHGKAKRG